MSLLKPMFHPGLILALTCPFIQETEVAAPEAAPPALTASTEEPSGVLRFSLHEPNGFLIPGRLTFVQKGNQTPELFPGVDARPDNLAVRKNVVYCLSGEDSITVPVGRYTVYATRGIEYSQAREVLEIVEGQETEWHPVLRQEVSTAGWISGDFHLHTLTHSGHGDANLKERVISLIGEGIEFAVATDHNHNTDYGPTMEELEASEEMAAVVGNEISTPIGHFNAFPLDPDHAVIDAGLSDANKLFKLIRQETNEYGIEPVIQLNHPRWAGIDYFTAGGLDPITGLSTDPNWSRDFDTIELLNENEGWGYHDADTAGDLYVGAGLHSVLQDWYNLLNHGHRYFVVGNSDSHTVHRAFAGYPRNFVRSSTDSPKRINPAEIAHALKNGRSFISLGPFIDFQVNGQGPGEVVRTTQHNLLVTVKVKAPSWIYLNRIKIIVDGDEHSTFKLQPNVLENGAIRWPTMKAVVRIHRDSWIHVIVEGDEGLEPIVTGKRPILPLAISNPIWIQTTNDGQHTSMWTWALGSSATRKDLDGLSPSEAAMVLHAGAHQRVPDISGLVRSGLAYGERKVQLAALRAIEKLELRGLTPVLLAGLTNPGDPYLALTTCRALKATEVPGNEGRVAQLFDQFGRDSLMRYSKDLEILLEGQAVRDWMVIGHFESPDPSTLFEQSFGPEDDDSPQATFSGKGGLRGWQRAEASEAGYLDLAAIAPETAPASVSFAQTWLKSEADTEVLYAIGSDDGCRLWLNNEEIYRDQSRHGAHPMQQVGRMNLKAGYNLVLVGVENGGGPSGLYFRVLSPGITNQAEHP